MINVLKLLPLNDWLWLGVAAALFGYHEYAMHDAVVQARSEVKASYETQIAKANEQAKADHDALQAQIDASANTDNAALAKQMDAIKAQLSAIDRAYKPKGALPVNCVLDADRIAQANKAMSQ